MLSAVMQEAAGRPFLELLEEFVFEPLNIQATGPEIPGHVENLVSFYNSDNGKYGTTRDVDMSIKWASGGLAFLLLVPHYNISVAFLANGAGENTRVELQMLAYQVAALVIENKSTIN